MSPVRGATLVAALMMALAPAGARAWCQMTSSSDAPTTAMPCVTTGVPLSWRAGCIAYAVDARGGLDLSAGEIEQVVDASFDTWLGVTCDGASPGFDVRGFTERATCQEAQFRSNRGNVNVVAMVDDWAERDYDPTAFAITTVWHNQDTGSILDVDVLVNEQLGPYAICPDSGCPPLLPRDQVVDLQNVITHELGHFFGIAHSDVPNATMYFSAARGETLKRSLAADDIEAMCTIYAPGTLNPCTDYAPRGGLDLNCEDDTGGGRGCSAAPAHAAPFGAGWSLLTVALMAGLAHRRRVRRRAGGHQRR